MTNQIRITLGLQGQQQVQAGLQQTARDTAAVGTAASGIEAELREVTAHIRAMGQAAAVAAAQLQQTRTEQAGLSTTAASAGQTLQQQRQGLDAVSREGRQTSDAIAGIAPAARAAGVAFGALKLIEIAGAAVQAAREFEGLERRINLVSRSGEQAAARLAFIDAEANRLGVSINSTARNYADFVAATRPLGFSDATTDNLFSTLNQAGVQFDLTQAQIDQNFDQFTRIATRAKVTMDDLGDTLAQNLPQALEATARGMGVTVDQLRQLIEDGRLSGRDILPAMAAGFAETFGLDTQRNIESTRAGTERLTNELSTLARTVVGPVNTGLNGMAGYLANLVRFSRENGLGGTLTAITAPFADLGVGSVNAVLGTDIDTRSDRIRQANTARDFVAANPFRPQLYNPNAERPAPFFGPGTPAASLGGLPLLSFGQTPARPGRGGSATAARDPLAAARTDAAILQEELRTGTALTGAARELFVLRRQTLTPANELLAKELEQVAALEVQVRLRREAQRPASSGGADREGEQALRVDLQREESLRQRVSEARTQAAIVEEELRTGTALTGAARELFILRRQAQDPASAVLATELETLAALEAQAKAQTDGTRAAQDAQRAVERADRGADAFIRRREPSFQLGPGERDPNPFERLEATRDVLVSRNDREFDRQLEDGRSALNQQIEAGTAGPEEFAAFAEKEEALAQAHADRLIEIDEGYAAARRAVFVNIAEATAGTLGELAEAAQNFGSKGFAAYKAFAIAQTLISTYAAAQKAFESLSSVPIVGPALGAAAAAAAVVNGLAQVGRIRAQQPAGRRFGGPVTAGQPYEVNESGITEVFRDSRSGRQYLIPGNSGEVTPAPVASGSRGGTSERGVAAPVNFSLNVVNTAGDRVQFSSRGVSRNDDGSLTLDALIAEVEDPGGRFNAASARRDGRPVAGRI